MKNLLLILFAGATLSSCVSLVNTQTGRTQGKGNTEIGLTAEAIPVEDDDLTSLGVTPGVFVYYGIGERVDLSFHWEGVFGVSAGAKVQLLGNKNSRFALALDPRTGVFAIPKTKTSSGIAPYTVVPGIVSFHLSEKFAIMAAEEWTYIPYSGEDPFFSPSLGLEIGGEKAKFTTGLTYNYLGQDFYMFGAGAKIKF